MNSQSNRTAGRFATTRWSMVTQFAATQSSTASDALGELAQRYRYPIYIYIRRCGHPPAAAEEIARRFLRQLLGEVSQEVPSRHLRSYLLQRLHAFLASGRHENGGDDGVAEHELMPPELEARYQKEHNDALSPDQTYQRGFALQVLRRTLRRLRSEARQTGHLSMYDALEPFLARDPGPGEYEQAASLLRSRPLTLVVALKRLRQRFRELGAEELTDTVTTAEDLASEQEELLRVLGELKT
ncbi:MAG: hypothetical protein ABJB01_07125 [Rudaea sp.]